VYSDGQVRSRTIIPASAKIKELLPPVRNFQRFGVKPSLVSDGVNAISDELDAINAGLLQRAAPIFDFIELPSVQRRLRDM